MSPAKFDVISNRGLMYVYIWHDFHDKIESVQAAKHNWYNKNDCAVDDYKFRHVWIRLPKRCSSSQNPNCWSTQLMLL